MRKTLDFSFDHDNVKVKLYDTEIGNTLANKGSEPDGDKLTDRTWGF